MKIKISRKAAKTQRRKEEKGGKTRSKFFRFSLCGFAALRETVDFIDVQFAQASFDSQCRARQRPD
ncbi:MAG TPA: hypothetical protein PLD20_29505 [Blastocatellia bacterium]|nr:hypothetical protein [Blastocatellia bacterium]HMY73015.1 hypothetical protein [Blastocatellia bacterium]HMZ22106.1 hypothetical protein [Blastocatellia bacterium]HNG32484.1 hypothetical protein [Blastocatellia bacterium]